MTAVEQAHALLAAADEALPRVRKGEDGALPALRAAVVHLHALGEACPRALGLHRRHRKRLAGVVRYLESGREAEGRRRWLEGLSAAGGNPVADHLHTELEARATATGLAMAAGLPRRWGKLSGRLQRLLKPRGGEEPATLIDCLAPALQTDLQDLVTGLTNEPGPDDVGRLHRLALVARRLEHRLGLLPGTEGATGTLDELATALAGAVDLHGLTQEITELGADLGATWGRQRLETALAEATARPDDPLPDAEALARQLARQRREHYAGTVAPWLGTGAETALAPVSRAIRDGGTGA
jgi:hypothetical protein